MEELPQQNTNTKQDTNLNLRPEEAVAIVNMWQFRQGLERLQRHDMGIAETPPFRGIT